MHPMPGPSPAPLSPSRRGWLADVSRLQSCWGSRVGAGAWAPESPPGTLCSAFEPPMKPCRLEGQKPQPLC